MAWFHYSAYKMWGQILRSVILFLGRKIFYWRWKYNPKIFSFSFFRKQLYLEESTCPCLWNTKKKNQARWVKVREDIDSFLTVWIQRQETLFLCLCERTFLCMLLLEQQSCYCDQTIFHLQLILGKLNRVVHWTEGKVVKPQYLLALT